MEQQGFGANPAPEKQPNSVLAIISIVCGALAMFLPVAVLDVVFGVAGIVLAVVAKKTGVKGLAIAGLVISIIGTVLAVSYTLTVLGVVAV